MIYEKELSDKIIDIAKKIYAELGYGFLEKVYENSMMHDFGKDRLHADQQYPLPVMYDGICVGQYFVDVIVENKIIIELKAINLITALHHAQLINYLKATGIKVGYIINFGHVGGLQYKRLVF
ncbi:MAG: GxxExxY protein [Candidatus Cloacimonetes bacterium]|nr:GxxExxY protein [Candidatus Cloacimonadota bacterium]